MKIFVFLAFLVTFNILHVEGIVRKCFPVGMLTENSTQSTTASSTPIPSTIQSSSTASSISQSNTTSSINSTTSQSNSITSTTSLSQSTTESQTQSTQTSSTKSSTQATDSTSTVATPINATELINNILDLDSQITTQEEYLQGNETAANQTSELVLSDISTSLADPNISQNETEILLNITQTIQNLSTPESSTGARRKRQNTTPVVLTPCLEAQSISQDLLNKMAKNMAKRLRYDSATQMLGSMKAKAIRFSSSLSNSYANVTNLISRFSGISNILSKIFNLTTQQKSDFDLIANAICRLNFGPCGSFTSYNPITNPNAPLFRAFSAGIYLDGTESYVGRASLEFPNTLIPGRCTTSGNLQGPGVYVELHGEKRMTDSSVQYLQNHYNLTWIPADVNNASTIPNAIKLKGDNGANGYLIGRYNLTNSNSTQYTQVAKVHIDNGFNNLWYADTNQNGQPASTAFEVLTCPVKNISSGLQNNTSIVQAYIIHTKGWVSVCLNADQFQ